MSCRLLEPSRRDLLAASAWPHRDERTHDVTTLAEALDAAKDGFARLAWDVVAGEGESRAQRAGRQRALPPAPRRLDARQRGRGRARLPRREVLLTRVFKRFFSTVSVFCAVVLAVVNTVPDCYN